MKKTNNDSKKEITTRIAKKMKYAKDLDLHSLVYLEGRIDQMLFMNGVTKHD